MTEHLLYLALNSRGLNDGEFVLQNPVSQGTSKLTNTDLFIFFYVYIDREDKSTITVNENQSVCACWVTQTILIYLT